MEGGRDGGRKEVQKKGKEGRMEEGEIGGREGGGVKGMTQMKTEEMGCRQTKRDREGRKE